SPGNAPLDGSSAKVTVTVATTSRTAGFVSRRPGAGGWPPGLRVWLLILAVLLSAVTAALVSKAASGGRHLQPVARRVALAGALAATLVLLGVMPACGGGGGSSNGGSSGTPAGTYSITLTGTSTQGSTTLNQALTLNLTVL
ncbi:MAG TPA: hypothetical protein VKU44_00715, partial [Terriglobia bacterium]|nr:hypothetical protein [Terriglobia bacterium]